MGVSDITKYTGLGADCTEKNKVIYYDTAPSSFAYYTFK